MHDQRKLLLLIVDIQRDFLPGGALAVGDGDAIIEPTRKLMMGRAFTYMVATQDWHPRGHISFASAHPGRKPFDTIKLYGRDQVLWPDHCVAGSAGAALSPGLPWIRVDAIIRKGRDPKVDSYSSMRNNWNEYNERPSTGLGGFIRELGVEDVYICGLARDYCVKWTAEDAAELGFRIFVLWDLTRPVDPDSNDSVRRDLEARGIKIVESSRLLPE